MEEIVIKLNKGKILLILLGAILFFIGGAIFVWMIADENPLDLSSLLIKSVSVLSALFGLVGCMAVIYKLFDSRPGLIINKEGITNNTSALSSQTIKWGNIEKFEVLQIASQKMLLIYINNPEEIIAKAGKFSRFWLSQSLNMYGTPIGISASSLQCNFDQLMELITKNQNFYGQNPDTSKSEFKNKDSQH